MSKEIGVDYRFEKLATKHNTELAKLIRYNLKKHGLDIPGTVYFDSGLDKLSEFYNADTRRGYYVLVNSDDCVVGGVGFAEFPLFENCAELQKLYLSDSEKGFGLGYKLIEFIEQKMLNAGYKASYLETHSNLEAAIHIYEKSGYERIARPKEVAHGAMNIFFCKQL